MRQTEVSRTSGSAYDLWLKMGHPNMIPVNSGIHPEKSSPDTFYREADVTDYLLIDITLPVHSVTLIEIAEEPVILK